MIKSSSGNVACKPALRALRILSVLGGYDLFTAEIAEKKKQHEPGDQD
ncbi:MAG: hypothetical protein WCF26_03875 [Candidatus Sulfotelmatobacter sp.]